MFRKFTSRLAAALSLAKPAELSLIAQGLDAAIAEGKRQDIAPPALAAPYGREPRYRMRDRFTKFSRRHPAKTPRELHELVNNKGVQWMYNPLLTSLLYGSGAMDVQHPKVEVTQ